MGLSVAASTDNKDAGKDTGNGAGTGDDTAKAPLPRSSAGAARTASASTRADQFSCAMSANSVYCGMNAKRAVPVGPLRCLETMISAMPRSAVSSL